MGAIQTQARTAPVLGTWIVLGIAWLMFLVPIPLLGLFIGWPLNLVAFILAIVVMARGRTFAGLIPLLASLLLSPLVYFIGLAIFTAVLGGAASGSEAYQQYMEAARELQEQAR